MFKKLIASLMAALMATLTLASPVLAAPVNTYPTFLGMSGDFYIVVGASGLYPAATIDVVGAVDVASNLAQLSYTTVSSGGTTTVDGMERKVSIPTTSTGGQLFGSDANTFPIPLRNYHFDGLVQGQYVYKGTTHNFHEEVRNGSTLAPQLTHSLIEQVNGTLKMKIDTQSIEYRYVFDDAIAAADWSYATPNATTYETPLEVNLMGQTLKIVAVLSSTSFKALSGNVGWISEGSSGLTLDGLSIRVTTVYSSTQASIEIVDANDNVVNNLGVITTSSTPPSITYQGETYKVKLLGAAAASISGQIGQAQLVFGRGDVEKTFDGGDQSTLSAWGSDWRIQGSFASAPQISSADYVKVVYNPITLPEADKYYTAGSAPFEGPGGYFELSYAGLTPNTFTQVTLERITGQTVYNASTDTSTAATNLNGLKITADIGGSITFNNIGYNEVYVLAQATPATSNTWEGSKAYIGYKDPASGKIVVFGNATWPVIINETDGVDAFNFTLSYGGPGASSTFVLNGTFNHSKVITDLGLYSTSREATLAFQNRTATSSDLMLGATAATAEANDVKARIEGSLSDVSLQLSDVLTDGGIWLYSVKTNTASDKVILGVPPETVYALVQFGVVGQTTPDGEIHQVVPITTAVAKLDSDPEIASAKTNKHLVLVGGSCVNALVQELVDAGMIDSTYTCTPELGEAWTADTGYIMVVDDAFATGKYVVVVAGTLGTDTRVASQVLQQWETKLSGVTSDIAKVTTSTATAIDVA